MAITGSATIGGAFTVAGNSAFNDAVSINSSLSYEYKINTPTTSPTITSSNSGEIYVLPDVNANNSFTITLPPAVEGLHYKFIIHQTLYDSTTWTTSTDGTDKIYGPKSPLIQGGIIIEYGNDKKINITAGEQNSVVIYELIAISSTTWLLSIGNLNASLTITYDNDD
jgi:hypothetical protein